MSFIKVKKHVFNVFFLNLQTQTDRQTDRSKNITSFFGMGFHRVVALLERPACDMLAQEPHQRDRAGAAGKRRFTETAEEVVVRQGPMRSRV